MSLDTEALFTTRGGTYLPDGRSTPTVSAGRTTLMGADRAALRVGAARGLAGPLEMITGMCDACWTGPQPLKNRRGFLFFCTWCTERTMPRLWADVWRYARLARTLSSKAPLHSFGCAPILE